jgi:hypothetical protein
MLVLGCDQLAWQKIVEFMTKIGLQFEFSTIGCSFKCILKVGIEESIVNAPRITDHGSAV